MRRSSLDAGQVGDKHRPLAPSAVQGMLAPALARRFAWLPDAALDPHPLLTWLVESAFDIGVHLLFRCERAFPADYALAPGILIVSNHQREMDVPVVLASLCQREGLRFRWPLPFCAGREDMLRSGFLGHLLAHWPGPLRGLLARVGRALPGRYYSRREFDARVRGALLRLHAVTPSHLASRFLASGPESFTEHEFAAWTDTAARAVAEAGVALDPLLAAADPGGLAAGRLAWLARARLIHKEGGAWHNQCPDDAAPGWDKPAAIVRYLDNVLDSVAASAPALHACLRPERYFARCDRSHGHVSSCPR